VTANVHGRSSQIVRSQSGATSDAGEHPWADLVCVVEGEHEIRPTFTREDPVRSGRAFHRPAHAHQRGEYEARLRQRARRSRCVKEIADLGDRFAVLEAVGEDAER